VRGRRREPRPRVQWRSPWTAAICLLTALAVGGVVTVAVLVKDVVLVVDGRRLAVHSFAGSVRELLGEQGVSFGHGDSVSPAGSDAIADGTRIVVRHARPITLTLDGHTSRRTVTATNVHDALAELDLDPAAGTRSDPARGRVPLSGMSLTVYTERGVYVETGGTTKRTSTHRRTVREVLRDEGIPVGGALVRPALGSFPAAGTVIKIMPPHTEPIPPGIAALDWAALADCESHGDSVAVNPAGPYYGLYQFSMPMWATVGGAGLPSEWPAEEQTYRAQLLYERVEGRWQRQWPSCGAKLFGLSGPAVRLPQRSR
jgi:hypothetical protein